MSKRDNWLISEWVREGSKMLDLGCGDGGLLELLERERKARCIGVEIDETLVSGCVARGLEVIHADIEGGLDIFRDRSFDYAVLSQTLQEMRDPGNVLREMMRVSSNAIVSLTNASHWRNRLRFLGGRVPVDEGLGAHEIRRLVSVADFEALCRSSGLVVNRKMYLADDSETGSALFADKAVYLLGNAAG